MKHVWGVWSKHEALLIIFNKQTVSHIDERTKWSIQSLVNFFFISCYPINNRNTFDLLIFAFDTIKMSVYVWTLNF